MIGRTLAHYEITAAIGKGGMGEVYQATDKKLGRSVAIKVLPEEFAQDTERIALFEREAKLLASLNHPNIAAIYGLEESEGTRFLVLELVEGQTLSEQLDRGPLPVQESLELALQIAEALEAAHEKGVIHRDLKPANIKVTSEGKVKVLDFGLAKAYAGTAVGDETVLETLAEDAAGGKGVLLGTPAYMSPEQARRQPADHRSDVWAFGCVLYEMLTGKTLFKQQTLSDTIAAILDREPEFGNLPTDLNPAGRRLLERCLEKNPKRRWHAIADVRLEIEAALVATAGVEGEPRARTITPYAVAMLALGILVAAPLGWYLRPVPGPEPRPITRFHFQLPDSQEFDAEFGYPVIAVSPDGGRIAYVADSQLHLWDLTADEVRPLPTDDNPADPLFSPDGQWVSYWSLDDRQLKKVAVAGGAPMKVCDVDPYFMCSWPDEDTIVFANNEGIFRVPSEGGTPQLLIAAKGEFMAVPQILPGGNAALFGTGSAESPQTVLQSLESGERTVLNLRGIDARYVPTGHIVYGMVDTLHAVPFDSDNLALTGNPVVIQQDVLHSTSANYAFGANGTFAYVPGGAADFRSTLEWMDGSGRATPLSQSNLEYRGARVSSTGDRVAVLVSEDGGGNIWIVDVESGTPSRLTDDGRATVPPAWTPDGGRVTLVAGRDIYWQAADGSGPSELLWSHHTSPVSLSWSPDGRLLAFDAPPDSETTRRDLWVYSIEQASAEPFLATADAETAPSFSPDGKWIAYTRQGSEIWVAPYPGPGTPHRIADGRGSPPLWSADGRELYYRDLDRRRVMAVPVGFEPAFTRGSPRELFASPYILLTLLGVHPDGNRFLVGRAGTSGVTEESNRINVVLNWFEELKEKVPVP